MSDKQTIGPEVNHIPDPIQDHMPDPVQEHAPDPMNRHMPDPMQEVDTPAPDLTVDPETFEADPHEERPRGRIYPGSRQTMPEKQLFEFAEYRPQEAERTGYSNYSYWKSVWQNFLKKKPAALSSFREK